MLSPFDLIVRLTKIVCAITVLAWSFETEARSVNLGPAGGDAGRPGLLRAGQSVQGAIDDASDGDVILLGRGDFVGGVDFRGKRLTLRGIGPETRLFGPGRGSVVRFARGEGRGSVIDSLSIIGGNAENGGGILVSNASPTLQRLVVFDNRAGGSGSGLYVAGARSNPLVRNVVFAYNDDSSPAITDAHQIFIDNGAAAVLLNNTIVRGNGNGILVQPSVNPSVIRNNLIAWNGSRLRGGAIIGRGICDFSGSAVIRNNLFFSNSLAAILTGSFVDFELVTNAELAVDEARFRDNLDGNPRLHLTPLARAPSRLQVPSLQLRSPSPARNAGSRERRFSDRNGSRNDIGHGGGPLGWRR